MRKVREFVSMVNNKEDARFKVRAFYNITKEGEIKNHMIYIEFKTILISGEEFKLLQAITVEAINFALVDKEIIFNEMVKKFFYEVEKKLQVI